MLFGDIPFPDGTFFVEGIAAAPVDSIERTIRSKVDANDGDAASDLHIVDHLEGCAVLFDLKAPVLAVGRAGVEEVIFPFFVQSSAWIEGHSSGSIIVK